MRKYYQSATKVFAAITAVCFLMIFIGVLLIVFDPDQLNLIFLFLDFGISFGILFLSCFLGCVLSSLKIDHEKIVFPVTRSPKIRLKRNTVLYNEIKCVKPIYYKGDGIVTKDTMMYRFVLNSGLEFTETFYQYGKKYEQEIVSRLQSYIRFS